MTPAMSSFWTCAVAAIVSFIVVINAYESPSVSFEKVSGIMMIIFVVSLIGLPVSLIWWFWS